MTLEIPRSEFPEGYDLQWVAVKLWNETVLNPYLSSGWEPVRHIDFGGRYSTRGNVAEDAEHIVFGGLLLMMRPQAVSDAAHERDKQKALGTENQIRGLLANRWHNDNREFIKYAMDVGWTPEVYDPPEQPLKWNGARQFLRDFYDRIVLWITERTLTRDQKRFARITCVSRKFYARGVVRMRRERGHGYHWYDTVKRKTFRRLRKEN